MKTLISIPIVISPSLDEPERCTPDMINKLFSEVKARLHQGTGIKFEGHPLFSVSAIEYRDYNCDKISAPYFTSDIIRSTEDEADKDFNTEFSKLISLECEDYCEINEDSIIKSAISDSEHVMPWCVCVNVYFLSAESTGNNIVKIKNDEAQEIRALIERSFDEITGSDCYVMNPMLGIVSYDEFGVSSFTVDGEEYYQQDEETGADDNIDLLEFSVTLRDLAEQRINKKNSYKLFLMWCDDVFCHVLFNKDKARFILSSYDDVSYRCSVNLLDLTGSQNSIINMLVDGMDVECYSEYDEMFTIENNHNVDYSSLDIPLKRFASYDNGSIISKARNGVTHQELLKSLIDGKSYIESIEGNLSKLNPTGIGVASYMRAYDGCYFHFVVTVFGKKESGDDEFIICEESFSEHGIIHSSENGSLYERIESFKEMAVRLGVDFWNIEREFEYNTEEDGLCNAQRSQIEDECRTALVFVMAEKSGAILKKSMNNEEICKKVRELIKVNGQLDDDEDELVKIYCDSELRYLSGLGSIDIVNQAIFQYAQSAKKDLPKQGFATLPEPLDSATRIKNPGLVAYGVVIDAPSSVIVEMKIGLSIFKTIETIPGELHDLRFEVCKEFGITDKKSMFFDICGSD
jgi:hypothetical protein